MCVDKVAPYNKTQCMVLPPTHRPSCFDQALRTEHSGTFQLLSGPRVSLSAVLSLLGHADFLQTVNAQKLIGLVFGETAKPMQEFFRWNCCQRMRLRVCCDLSSTSVTWKVILSHIRTHTYVPLNLSIARGSKKHVLHFSAKHQQLFKSLCLPMQEFLSSKSTE